MSSATMSLPFRDGKVFAKITQTSSGRWFLNLVDYKGHSISRLIPKRKGGKIVREAAPSGVLLSERDLTQLMGMSSHGCQWFEATVWALLGGDCLKHVNAKPMASTYAHPGALRV